jgi:hypothetical protein
LQSWVDVFLAEVVAEVVPVSADIAWQGLPKVALCGVNIPHNRFYFLVQGKPIAVSQFLIFLQEFTDRLFDVASKVWCQLRSRCWHGCHSRSGWARHVVDVGLRS